jgi:hypothetical protein
MKLCPKCIKEKPLEDFHKDAWSKDGLRVYCKECSNDYTKKYRKPEKREVVAKAEIDSSLLPIGAGNFS